jgi:hypothetical protein
VALLLRTFMAKTITGMAASVPVFNPYISFWLMDE